MAVLENRVKANNADPIMRKVFSNWQWAANYDEAPGGRIWVVWDRTKVEFEVKQAHEQYIAGQVSVRHCNTNFNFVAVYGKHNIQDRKILWEDLKGTMNGVTGPSLIMGDFNSILSIEDRVQGNPVQEVEVKDFKIFIIDAGLDEIRTMGRKYTWTNNHVHSRIDRILVNAEWIQKWPTMEGIIMNPRFSDHCPLKVTITDTVMEGKRPFKFFNCLAAHHDFDDILNQCWRMRHRQLNSQEYSSVGHKIQAARNKLENIQMGMTLLGNDNEAIVQKKEDKFELEKWLEVEESIVKQKSRIKWLKLGDSNTSYFHVCVKNRQAMKHIGRLMDSAGQILQSNSEVEEEILSFYKKLLGTAASQLPVVDPEIMQSGYTFNRQQQLQLIQPITKEEVKKALHGIDDSKAPGCD
ncbi:PREDICTED: uncharacterized protein LOC109213752 [Nicotiana attenuata]|uniref:uncharacterized protein LOC109213752 n=1 Tax=Nicotiana attenuata TaxID=49451 RepID=UPI0009048414|nr:PREDICTED: uncharacterized protein LOC109213752 [Nicotiana attenuata]